MTIPASDNKQALRRSTPSPKKKQRSFLSNSPIPKSKKKAAFSFSSPSNPSPLNRENSFCAGVDGINKSIHSARSADSGTSLLSSSESTSVQYPLKSCLKKEPKRGLSFLPNLKLRQKRNKTVTFDNYDSCKWTIALQDYSKSEYKDSFLCDKELEQSLDIIDAIAEKERQRRKRNNPNEKGYMTRGIEKVISHDRVVYHRREAYAAVLRDGVFIPDNTDIELYKTISRKCLVEAFRVAGKDAEFARRYQQDNNNTNKDTTKDTSDGELSSRKFSRSKTPERRENRKSANNNNIIPNPSERRQRPSSKLRSRQPSRATSNKQRQKQPPPPAVRTRRSPKPETQ